MKEIEDRLRDAFDADAQTVRPETVRPLAHPAEWAGARTGLLRWRGTFRGTAGSRGAGHAQRGKLVVPLMAAAAVGVVVVVLAVVLPILRPGSTSQHPGAAARPPEGFLTVTQNGPVIHGDQLVKYGTSTLQLRSVHGGLVVTTLLHSLADIDAVMAPDGSVIAVEDFGCRARILRISPRTDQVRLIRTLPESASSIALSPDGRQLAYLTYPVSNPHSCTPARQPAAPIRYRLSAGLPQFLPNVLAIVRLASGTVVHAATSNPGNPPWDPAWSPGGKLVAVVYAHTIAVLPAARPDFATARRVRPPHGCGYVAATWTTTGLLAVSGCGRLPELSPRTLVRLSVARPRQWRLPACIDGAHLVVDPTFSHVLVQSDVGYGNPPPCGAHYLTWSAHIAEVRPASLAPIAILPQGDGGDPQVTGW